MSETCLTCRWWDTPNREVGQCRRFPPVGGDTNFNDYGLPRFPKTSPNDWCGEHTTAPHTATQSAKSPR